jgi:hypothetical protein
VHAKSIVGGPYDMKDRPNAYTGSVLEDAAWVEHFPLIPRAVFVANAVEYSAGIRKAYRVKFIAERAGGDFHTLQMFAIKNQTPFNAPSCSIVKQESDSSRSSKGRYPAISWAAAFRQS